MGIWAGTTALAHGVLVFWGWTQWSGPRLLGYEFIPQLGRTARLEPGFGLANLMGVVAVAWLLVMTATSFDRAVRALGPWLCSGCSWPRSGSPAAAGAGRAGRSLPDLPFPAAQIGRRTGVGSSCDSRTSLDVVWTDGGCQMPGMPVAARVDRQDAHRRMTGLAVAGLALGAAMAVLGLPPLDLHGPLHYVGVMDPFCGGTRSVRLAMRGEWTASWRYNPLGLVLVAGAVLTLARSGLGVVTGRWLTLEVRRRRLVLGVVLAGLALLWLRQQLSADLLMAP